MPKPGDGRAPDPGAGGGPADARPSDAAMPDAGLPEFPLATVKAARAEVYAQWGGHMEGPSWQNGNVYFASDGNGLMRVGADRKVVRYHPRLDPVGSYALADGSLLLCEKTNIVVQVFPDGKVGVIANQYQGQKIGFCNDVTVDGDGNIFFSEAHAGIIYRITPAGEVARVAGGINYPNGVEVDPESNFLYFGTGGSVRRIALPKTGTTFPAAETVLDLGNADGMAFDIWGHLWVAQVQGGNIAVVDVVAKKTIVSVSAGGGLAINLTFGGPERDAIFAVADNRGVIRIPVGARGFMHPGAAKYTIKQMLDLAPSAP
jgi:sugar lactone lactonase YvrE